MASPILLVLLIAISAAIVLGVRSRLLARRDAHREAPQCGCCGYDTRGVSTLQCPECGSDLRQVGIILPGNRRGVSVGGWLLLWTVVVLIGGGAASAFLMETVLPKMYLGRAEVNFGGGTTAISRFTLRFNGSYYIMPLQRQRPRSPVGQTQVHIVLNSGQSLQATIDESKPGYRITHPPSRAIASPAVFDASVIESWLQAEGLDTSEPALQTAVSQIIAEFATVAPAIGPGSASSTSMSSGGRGNVFSSRGSSSGSSTITPPWIVASLFLLWTVVWIAGVVRIVPRRGPA